MWVQCEYDVENLACEHLQQQQQQQKQLLNDWWKLQGQVDLFSEVLMDLNPPKLFFFILCDDDHFCLFVTNLDSDHNNTLEFYNSLSQYQVEAVQEARKGLEWFWSTFFGEAALPGTLSLSDASNNNKMTLIVVFLWPCMPLCDSEDRNWKISRSSSRAMQLLFASIWLMSLVM